MPLGAGRLDTRCIFEKPVKVSDGGGGSTVVWTEQFTVWGGFLFPSTRTRMEALAAGAVQTVISGQLTVRDGRITRRINKDWRVLVHTDTSVSPTVSEVWNVRKVYPRQRDGFIRMEVEAGVPV